MTARRAGREPAERKAPNMESNARVVWSPEAGWTDDGPEGNLTAESGRITFTPATEPTVIRWQYCQDGFVIDGNPYAEDDADMVRAWEGAHGDFCLVEVTRTAHGRWSPSGGDGDWTRLLEPSGNRTYPSPGDALTQLVGDWREATEADERAESGE